MIPASSQSFRFGFANCKLLGVNGFVYYLLVRCPGGESNVHLIFGKGVGKFSEGSPEGLLKLFVDQFDLDVNDFLKFCGDFVAVVLLSEGFGVGGPWGAGSCFSLALASKCVVAYPGLG